MFFSFPVSKEFQELLNLIWRGGLSALLRSYGSSGATPQFRLQKSQSPPCSLGHHAEDCRPGTVVTLDASEKHPNCSVRNKPCEPTGL